MTGACRMQRAGFTLVKLIAGLAIMAILAALFFGGMRSVRESSERAKCAGNLRTLGVAIHAYTADNNGRLPPGNRASIGNFGRLLSAYTAPMKSTTMSADVFYCPGNVRLGSPPMEGYAGGYKGWSGYFFNYVLNASLFPITSSDPNSTTYIPDHEAVVSLGSILIPSKTVALMDMPTRAPGTSGPPTSGLARGTYFDPNHAQFILGTVHDGLGNILFIDGHVEAFNRTKPLPVNSLPGRETTWWPE